MKAMAAFGFFLLFLGGFALVSMLGKQVNQQGISGGGASLTGIHWRLEALGAESVADDSGMFISFDVDGSIRGHGGCNGFSGALQQTESGISFGSIAATRMACPEPVMSREAALLEAMQQTSSFEASSDRLQLVDENRVVLAEFIAEG